MQDMRSAHAPVVFAKQSGRQSKGHAQFSAVEPDRRRSLGGTPGAHRQKVVRLCMGGANSFLGAMKEANRSCNPGQASHTPPPVSGNTFGYGEP
jgi:hypothetical protein